MKYRPTPFNIFSLVLIAFGIYYLLYPGPMGYGILLTWISWGIAILFLLADAIFQHIIDRYKVTLLIQTAALVAILAVWCWWTNSIKAG